MGLKFAEQGIFFSGAKGVAGGVGNHGHAASVSNPVHGVFQAGPTVRHKPRFAFGEVFAKHLIGFAAHPGFDQVARKVGTGNQLRVACELQCALISSFNARRSQAGGHFLSPQASPAAGLVQPFLNVVVFGIKAQAHNVNGLTRKGDGNFCARQIAHAQCLGGRLGPLLAAHFVMVG